MMQRQYPFCVLYFTMDAERLDINVHPTKMELRFSNNEEIYKALYQAIRDALTHREFIPDVPVDEKREEKRRPIEASIPEPFEKRRIRQIRNAVAWDSPYERKYPEREHKPPEAASARQAVREETAPEAASTVPPEAKRPVAENQSVFDKLLARGGQTSGLVKEPDTYRTDAISDDRLSVSESAGIAGARSSAGSTGSAGVGSSTESTGTAPGGLDGGVYEQQTFLAEDTGFFTEQAAKKHRIIGQLFDTYWLIEYEDKLFVIDQHAAHEKVLYEKTMARVRTKEFVSQTISPPVILTLGLQEQEMLERYGEQIRSFGYEIEPFGGKEYAINAIPADFESVDMKSMFIDLLDDFSNLSGREAPELILEKVASMSCKAAIKGGDSISRPEAERLIDELLSLENPYHCPHGRPTIISMSKYEIEKKFKRIV